MTHRIAPMEPARSPSGYWTHPDYFVPAGDRCDEAPGEFDAWLLNNRLNYTVSWLDNEVPAQLKRRFGISRDNVSAWLPAPPPGAGWFIASIHDAGQGTACIWLRHREGCDETVQA